jgi:hypothetical protein
MSTKSPNLAPVPGEPDWIAVLRSYARTHGIAEAGRRIGRSRPSVSLVLSGDYPGGTTRIEALVRKALMDQVRCPGFGEDLPLSDCRDWSSRPFSAASPRSSAMYRACRTCPNKPALTTISKGDTDA